MSYKKAKYRKSRLKSVEILEGEPIELKIERITSNNEPITDGAPKIYTERKDGVGSAYNIRTDRWEIASEAMDKVSGSIDARRDHKAKVKEKEEVEEKGKVVELKKDNEVKSIEGTNE